MLDICEPLDAEERLIVNVGIEVSRISNGSPTSDAIKGVADVRAGGKRDGPVDNVYSDVPGLNGRSCGLIYSKRRVVGCRVRVNL